MKYLHNHKVLLFFLFFFMLGAMILLVVALQREQKTISQAQKSTVLAFSPISTETTPIVKQLADAVPLDIIVRPGNNLVTVVHLVMTYDKTKLEAEPTIPFSPNMAAFPTVIEGPFVTPGRVALTLSIGADPTKAISTDTKAGTLHLKAIGATDEQPTMISISMTSEVLSAGVDDQATENVLSSSVPAYVSILPGSGTVDFSVNLLLHGIGHSGDNPNPNAFSLSNQDPLRPVRNVELEIINGATNALVATASGIVIYNELNGNFVGTASATTKIPVGQYLVKIHSGRYLRRYVPGFITLTGTTKVALPQISLVTSDSNDDNKLNILDYNMILDCYSGSMPVRACNETSKKDASDANDDGTVNQYDYNLFLRELSVQNGD